MSMQVDLSSELTEQERKYLAERGRYADIERADGLTGGTAQDLGDGDGSGPQLFPMGSAEARAARREQLQRELAALEEADDDTDAETSADSLPPYAEWTVPDLDAELKVRKLSTAGTKPEKVARLEQDDAANAE